MKIDSESKNMEFKVKLKILNEKWEVRRENATNSEGKNTKPKSKSKSVKIENATNPFCWLTVPRLSSPRKKSESKNIRINVKK